MPGQAQQDTESTFVKTLPIASKNRERNKSVPRFFTTCDAFKQRYLNLMLCPPKRSDRYILTTEQLDRCRITIRIRIPQAGRVA